MSHAAHTNEAAEAQRMKDQLLDHEYDGIREFDNPTPGWWHAIFFATVLFSLLYWAIFSFSPMAPSPQKQVAARQAAEVKRIFGAMGELQNDAATLNKLRSDDKLMSVAQGWFAGNCASCHGADGGGINGVNLCDDHYKNVKKLEDIYTVISKGANVGAMPPQETRYSQNERILLAAYVAHLRGSKPTTPRAAEGDVIPPW
ncbi:MAG TPA: cbb3-type cytochrome c oxidase N-terminal domain-containing protein [Phycisphaerales bacterium]|nr:cbb3-type cytochrome c oxidase N-terminal domain-containing protein [Phycisphaerales bacterium]